MIAFRVPPPNHEPVRIPFDEWIGPRDPGDEQPWDKTKMEEFWDCLEAQKIFRRLFK